MSRIYSLRLFILNNFMSACCTDLVNLMNFNLTILKKKETSVKEWKRNYDNQI